MMTVQSDKDYQSKNNYIVNDINVIHICKMKSVRIYVVCDRCTVFMNSELINQKQPWYILRNLLRFEFKMESLYKC